MAEEVKKEAESQSAPRGRGRARERVVEEKSSEFIERVVKIRRISKVVKGGKNFGFNAVVVAGDGNGNVGVGMGKGKEVADAISKGSAKAKKNFRKVTVRGNTIPHVVIGKFKATQVILKPAGPGTGVIAGGPVRALCDAVGIKDILTKSLGSRNPLNVINATLNGFDQLRLVKRG